MNYITISEMIGTNGEIISKKLANELNYSFVGDEELLAAAAAMGFLPEVVKLEEKPVSFLEKIFSDKPKIYLNKFQSVIFEMAQKGDTVFFGGGAQFLLQSFDCAFHVLIVGSLAKRIERIMEEKKVAKEVAEKIIAKSDHDKTSFMRFAYDEDWLNWRLYDLIINTDKLGVASAIKIIIEGATANEIKACGWDSLQLLNNLSLNRRLEAALIEAGIMSSHIFYQVEGNNDLRIYGIVYSAADKERAEKIIKGIGAIKNIRNELIIYPGSTT